MFAEGLFMFAEQLNEVGALLRTSTPQHVHPGPMALPKSNQQPGPKPLPYLTPLRKTAEQMNMMR